MHEMKDNIIMETKELQSTQFTALNAMTKDLINNGVFFLYSVNIVEKPNVHFLLSTDKSFFLVSDDGTPLEKIDNMNNINITARILFSDIKKSVESNSFIASWAL